LNKLRKTDFFSNEFIENYNQEILALDRELRKKEFKKWTEGDWPKIIFSNDFNPWCLCQDVPYYTPNPWEAIEIEKIALNDSIGEFNWKWGNISTDSDPTWRDFKYKFKVVKENEKWKISYMQGFNFKETKKKKTI
jgi:hypothetical protein